MYCRRHPETSRRVGLGLFKIVEKGDPPNIMIFVLHLILDCKPVFEIYTIVYFCSTDCNFHAFLT